jgi:hypothetical protein
MTQDYKARLVLCRELTGGNSNAAELLYRIAFWQPLAWIKSDGKRWIAHDRTWWMQQTGMSFDQIKRALTLLRRKSLIETRQGIFGNRNVLHVRLIGQAAVIPKFDEAQDEGSASHASSDAAPLDQSTPAPPKGGGNAPLYIVQGGTAGKVQQGEHSALAHANPDPGKIKEGSQQESKGGGSGGNLSTAATADEAMEPSPKGTVGPASTVASLEAIWRATVVKVCGGHAVPLTSKQQGQLKYFLTACPTDTAAAVLEYAVQNWSLFTQQAKSDEGAFNMPGKPEVGFLVKFSQVAVNFWLSKPKKPLMTSPSPKPPSVAMKLSTKKPQPEEKPATKEEVLAILAGT